MPKPMNQPTGRASRRGFLRNGTALGALAAGASLTTEQLFGQIDRSRITSGDIAILKFLAAAELIEDDLWQQYCELAVSNPAYNRALRRIDRSLVRYICDDRDDERSHAALINAFLVAIGETPVNLDPFRRLPSVNATGAQSVGRITNLTRLNVDTSWYNRYRSPLNPDFGATFPQLVNINGRATVPVSNNMPEPLIQLAAHAASFHFCAIEQGGASLYNGLLSKVSSLDVLAIVAAIGPTEIVHFTGFHKSLENLPPFSFDGLSFPNLRDNRELAEGIFPEPCQFLRADFPLCSVVRPRANDNSGPLAAAIGLVESGLFTGQGSDFLDAVVALATAANNATRAF